VIEPNDKDASQEESVHFLLSIL